MKKLLIIFAIIITICCLQKEEKVIIPKDAIRFRVIAASNSDKDQNLKKIIVHNLNKDINNLNLTPKNIVKAREEIQKNIPNFETTINATLNSMKSSESYSINYGMNHFPQKEYKGLVYEEGDYESLVVTLGNGAGDNFWCILFPPLCLLEGEKTETEDIQYTSFIKEIINKYF